MQGFRKRTRSAADFQNTQFSRLIQIENLLILRKKLIVESQFSAQIQRLNALDMIRP